MPDAASLVEQPISTLPQIGTAPPHVIRGADNILPLEQPLRQWAAGCGKQGAFDDLAFFLRRNRSPRKTPYLLLFGQGIAPGQSLAKLEGAVLLHEYRLGVGSGIFAIDDTTGRRCLVTAAGNEPTVAARAAAFLLKRGGHLVALPSQSWGEDHNGAAPHEAERLLAQSRRGWRYAVRQRPIQGYLPLAPTVEDTMRHFGKRTRNHLRYYRKKAEREIGCTFIPDARPTLREYLQLNAMSGRYRVSTDAAERRFRTLRELSRPMLSGLRHADGRWVSLAGGRRFGASVEMFWQMNHAEFASLSLSTAMRTYLIEHEVTLGTERYYFEGGTTSSLSHAFVPVTVTDVVAHRNSLRARLFLRFATHVVDAGNALPEILSARATDWRRGTV